MDWSSFQSALFGGALGAAFAIAAERIKARISGEFWVAQERWKLKRDIYTQLLTLLHQQRRLFSSLSHRLQGCATEQDVPTELQNSVVKKLTEDWAPLRARVLELRAVGGLWLRRETFEALDRTTESRDDFNLRFADRELASLDKAIDLVTREAHLDLRLEVRGT